MPACRTIVSLAVVVAMTLCAGVARAQAPAQVNKPGAVTQGTEVKDENGKSMRLKKNDTVTVIYERGEYFWVKNRKGQQAWVLKKFVRIKEEGAVVEPEKTEPVKAKTPKKPKPKKTDDKAEEAKTEAKAEEAKAEEAKTEETRTEVKAEETKTETLVAANTTNYNSATAMPSISNKRPGVIDVVASEAGARVSVDGQDVGAAPLRGVQVKGGPHVVTVEKPGFQPSNAQVEVDGGAAQLALALVPTVKTREEYESGAMLLRIAGYAGLGLGAGVVLAGLGMGGWGLSEAGSVRTDIDNYNRSENRTEQDRTDLVARRDGAQLKFLIGEVTLISGLAVAAVGVVAYMLAGDPDRYAAYSSVK